MPSARHLLAQLAHRLVQEGFEPGEDFSAREGELLCTQAARACLLEQPPPGWSWRIRHATRTPEYDPVELLESQVGVPNFFEALVRQANATVEQLADDWAAVYASLLVAYLCTRHPYLNSVDVVGAMLLSHRTDAIVHRMEKVEVSGFTEAEGDWLIERILWDVLQPLGGKSPQHFTQRGDGQVAFTWAGYERLALALESPAPGPDFLELSALLFETRDR
ncbi:MAG: hypothetical protein BRC58_06600 [Cyanobacteria bacterium QS_8_64_29]|nr:MAG: hypothetical protein BRC58_06600 [Cyanobacteria bacterium QS_8_64_29]